MAESETGQEPWVSLAEAARRLGRNPDGLRAAIRRGTLKARKGNGGQWLVQVPAGVPTESDSADDRDAAGQLAALREELAESRVAAARAEAERDSLAAAHARERDSLSGVVADLRAERDRLAAELAEARKPMLVRLLEAFRRR